MKLAPLSGLFFSHIPNTSIGILECKFNKMKYFKADQGFFVTVRVGTAYRHLFEEKKQIFFEG